ncbi:hypothetical protein RchiOBHm_Chr7g0199821 [Rosa chinensis]|uniref:Uncharacterized protein n=1 Tax=Rosa chinensis TaxID=74649 RepID=A0A2P6P7K8_ROSCH|nr:hypothetical protein RchiOBHm_Chr7g0199821 [Rosa chinensis]
MKFPGALKKKKRSSERHVMLVSFMSFWTFHLKMHQSNISVIAFSVIFIKIIQNNTVF